MIEPFCDEYLNEEYKTLCFHVLEKLCRKQDQHMKPSAMAERIGLSPNTVSGKSREIRKMLKMSHFGAEWTLPSKLDENPLIWIVNVNGLPMDAWCLPIELQELCYEERFIPYIPALQAKDTDSSEDEDSEN